MAVTKIPNVINWTVTPINGVEGYFARMNTWLSESTTVIASMDEAIDKFNIATREINSIAINAISAMNLDTLTDLRDLEEVLDSVWVSGYNTKNDGAFGSKIFRLKGIKTTEIDNGGTVIIPTIAGVEYVYELQYNSGSVNVKWFGVTGLGTIDDTPIIQGLLNLGFSIYLPKGSYKISNLKFTTNYQTITGEGTATYVNSILTSGSVISSASQNSVTIIGCKVSGFIVSATNLVSGYIIDWKSMQLGQIEEIWGIGGGGISTGISLLAKWITTECTYNNITNCYFGSVKDGIVISDGANSNTIINLRTQPSVSGGWGIKLVGTEVGRVSSNTIVGGGTEYPGNISNGILVGGGTDGTSIFGHRCEQLNKGVEVYSDAKNTSINGVYFDSCTTDYVNNSSSTLTLAKNIVDFSQKRVNETSNRVLGTQYVNTSKKDITVHLNMSFLATDAVFTITIGGLVTTIKNGAIGSTSNTFVVKAGEGYLCGTPTGNITILKWEEIK